MSEKIDITEKLKGRYVRSTYPGDTHRVEKIIAAWIDPYDWYTRFQYRLKDKARGFAPGTAWKADLRDYTLLPASWQPEPERPRYKGGKITPPADEVRELAEVVDDAYEHFHGRVGGVLGRADRKWRQAREAMATAALSWFRSKGGVTATTVSDEELGHEILEAYKNDFTKGDEATAGYTAKAKLGATTVDFVVRKPFGEMRAFSERAQSEDLYWKPGEPMTEAEAAIARIQQLYHKGYTILLKEDYPDES